MTDNRFEDLLSANQSQPQLEEAKNKSKLSSAHISSMNEVSGLDFEDGAKLDDDDPHRPKKEKKERKKKAKKKKTKKQKGKELLS